VFLVVGAVLVIPLLVELAGVILIATLAQYLMFYPIAILLRHKKVELSWWVPPGDQPGGALAVERPFLLHIAFRNHGRRRLRVLSTAVFAATGLTIVRAAGAQANVKSAGEASRRHDPLSAIVRAGQQVEITAAVRPLAAGCHVFHGAALTFGDALNLFTIEAFFPNPIAVKVFPRALALRSRPATFGGGALHERVGIHAVMRRGPTGELRELRQHTHGDPFKFIAWKATARRRQLMVRELQHEMVTTHMVVVDVGSSMREGAVGGTRLDWACDAAAALGRATIASGDRVGIVCYDTRPLAELAPASGHHHYLRYVDRLLHMRSVVDADLTDITAGELVATVARYLAHQEAVDVRIRQTPPLADPRWQDIQAGPDGQLYDVTAAALRCTQLCEAMGTKADHEANPPPIVETNAQLRVLRRFCRLRGIELPYRTAWEHGLRVSGFAAAAERVRGLSRPDVVVLISDLSGLAEDEVRMKHALARLRGAAGKVIAVVPSFGAFLPEATTTHGRRVRELLIADQRAAIEPGRRMLLRHGISVTTSSSAPIRLRKFRDQT
jgi:uncharacterized protein (DUF58 family)